MDVLKAYVCLSGACVPGDSVGAAGEEHEAAGRPAPPEDRFTGEPVPAAEATTAERSVEDDDGDQ